MAARRLGDSPTGLAIPNKTRGHGNPQLAALRLGVGRLGHPDPELAKLEFRDAPFHTQQKTVVGLIRIVDPIEVDHPRIDETTDLE